MPTIYSSTPAPWKTSQATITTFKSGLLRVDQEYLVPTADLSDFYPQFQAGQQLEGIDSPAFDGLYIYPTPQFENNGDGLTAINVSAYGRVSNQSTDASYFEERVKVGDISATRLVSIEGVEQISNGPIFSRVSFSLMQLKGSIVLPADEDIFSLDFKVEAAQFPPFDFVGTADPFAGLAPTFDLSVTEVTPFNIAGNGTTWFEVKLTRDGTTGLDDLDPPFIYYAPFTNYPRDNSSEEHPGNTDRSTPLVMLPQTIEITNITHFGYWTEYEFRTVRPMTYFFDESTTS